MTVARIVRLLIYGPEPIGAANALALQRASARQVSGRPGGPVAHFGMRGDPALTWNGYTASPQQFQGNVQMGKATAVVQEYPALPNDAAPTAIPGWLASMETLSRTAP